MRFKFNNYILFKINYKDFNNSKLKAFLMREIKASRAKKFNAFIVKCIIY